MRRQPFLFALSILSISVCLLAAASAQEQVTVKTTLVSPSPLRTGYMPSPLPVAAAPGFTAAGLPALQNPITGMFELPGYPGHSWRLVIDEPAQGASRVFFDANGNGDFSDDPAITWDERNGTRFATIAFLSPVDAKPVSFNIYRFLDNPKVSEAARARRRANVFFYRNYHNEGLMHFGGTDYRIALIDMDNDGRYGLGEDDSTEVIVDRNADGTLVTASGSAEEFSAEEPFEVGGSSWKIAAVAADGTVTLTQSAVPAAPKPYLDAGYPALPVSFNDAISSAPVDLAKYRGKIVLIDFWATWCGPCIAELPNVLDIYDSTPRDKFDIIGISLDGDDTSRLRPDDLKKLQEQYNTTDPAALQKAIYAANLEKMKGFCAEKKMTWPQYYDGKGWANEMAKQWRVSGIPATFLVGPEGVIVARNLRGEALKTKVNELLSH